VARSHPGAAVVGRHPAVAEGAAARSPHPAAVEGAAAHNRHPAAAVEPAAGSRPAAVVARSRLPEAAAVVGRPRSAVGLKAAVAVPAGPRAV